MPGKGRARRGASSKVLCSAERWRLSFVRIFRNARRSLVSKMARWKYVRWARERGEVGCRNESQGGAPKICERISLRRTAQTSNPQDPPKQSPPPGCSTRAPRIFAGAGHLRVVVFGGSRGVLVPVVFCDVRVLGILCRCSLRRMFRQCRSFAIRRHRCSNQVKFCAGPCALVAQ